MSDFENFLCSVTRLRSSRSTPLRRRRGKTKKVFKIAHIIWPLMKEAKNVSKSIIYEGNDRILLSESNLRSGFPVTKLGFSERKRGSSHKPGFSPDKQGFSKTIFFNRKSIQKNSDSQKLTFSGEKLSFS